VALERLAASIPEAGDAKMERARPWSRRLMATLAPVTPDIAERLARHYAAEVRLARGLAQDAASLVRYPHSRVRLLGAAERMLPFVLAPVMVGLTWKLLLQDQFGLINYYLRRLGFSAPQWLSDPSFTMITIIGLEIWQYTPFVVLILYAGLQAIPGEIRESARVDGASAFQMFRFITVPHLMSLILIVVLFRVIFALRTFDVVYTLFKSGGPGNAGMVLGVYLYEELKVSWELGKASAISYVILILTVVLSVSLTWRTMRAEPG
jgi:ABC-type sugar transport system permease subunit